MRTVGIIAEYNPFHTGHEYHIKKAKELAGADYAIAVMSPDFVQRGEPAIFDKYTRARMALLAGADLVIELPVCYATGSAEFFAEGAVSILNGLGVVDALCFGAELSESVKRNGKEADYASVFQNIAGLLLEEPASYQDALRDGLRGGLTFPQARARAVKYYLQEAENAGETEAAKALEILSSPNNILGMEYCKALRKSHSSIVPLPVLRRGSRYHDRNLNEEYCSASALRSRIAELFASEQNSVPAASFDFIYDTIPWEKHIPASCADLFRTACKTPVFADDLLPILTQKLLYADVESSKGHSLCEIFDLSQDLADRILRLRYLCIGNNFAKTVSLIRTKQMTEARIRRALLHLILDIRESDVLSYRETGPVFYAHILGFRQNAAPLLHEIKKRSALPLISKASHASDILSERGSSMWKSDIAASHLYRSLLVSKYRLPFRTEYEISPVRIPES